MVSESGLYQAETFYWCDPAFPWRKAMRVTAAAVARWCRYYYAKLLAGRKECRGDIVRTGLLPEDPSEKDSFLDALFDWIEACSHVSTFRLILHDEPISDGNGDARFAYYEEVDSWFLRLTEREFRELQDAWRSAGLPEDLFSPEEEFFCVPWRGTGFLSRLWRFLGVRKCYSPREAEAAGVRKEDRREW